MHSDRSGPPQDGASEVLIFGVTASGDTFRPSDWPDRLCGVLSIFGEDQRISYSPYVKPMVSNGRRCVRVDTRLKTLNPEAFEFLMGFASDNDLCVGTEGSEPPPGAQAPGGPDVRGRSLGLASGPAGVP